MKDCRVDLSNKIISLQGKLRPATAIAKAGTESGGVGVLQLRCTLPQGG